MNIVRAETSCRVVATALAYKLVLRTQVPAEYLKNIFTYSTLVLLPITGQDSECNSKGDSKNMLLTHIP